MNEISSVVSKLNDLSRSQVDLEIDQVANSDQSAPICGRIDRLGRLQSTQTIDSTLTKSDRFHRPTRLTLYISNRQTSLGLVGPLIVATLLLECG